MYSKRAFRISARWIASLAMGYCIACEYRADRLAEPSSSGDGGEAGFAAGAGGDSGESGAAGSSEGGAAAHGGNGAAGGAGGGAARGGGGASNGGTNDGGTNDGGTSNGGTSNGGVAGDDRLPCRSVLPLELNSDQGFPEFAAPLCQLLPGGSGKMTFDLPTCRDGSYAACDFAVGANLNAFDADNSAGGVLEIEFCVSQRMSGQLNLWYGTFPTRKKVELLGAEDVMEAGACKVVHAAPEEAICHWTALPAWAGDCTSTNAGADLSCRACGGRCNDGCDITFASAKLTLVAEHCTHPFGNGAIAELKAIRFLPKECACASTRDCAGSLERTECRPGLFSSRVCPPSASLCGVCVPPAPTCLREGENCVVRLSDRDCPGTIQCRGATSSCEILDQSCVAN